MLLLLRPAPLLLPLPVCAKPFPCMPLLVGGLVPLITVRLPLEASLLMALLLLLLRLL
jgi:hypothetical protein